MSKYAIITGGTKGIGFSIAKCLGKMGYNMLLTYGSDTTSAQDACNALNNDYNIEVTAIRADSSDRYSIEVVSRHIIDEGIRVDAVILNAGITDRDAFGDIKYENWERVFFANIHFPTFLLQRLINNINAGGNVILTGSLMGITPHAMSLSYGVTKAATHSLVKNLVKFLVPRNIRINAVAPGFVNTEWQKNKPAEIRRNIENKISVGRFCEPDELASIYKLLIENTYINGEIIIADGGYSYK